MSAISTVTIRCDHLGCEEAVENRDAGTARRQARRAGWAVGIKKGATFRDYCPEHRTNGTFYG